MRVRVRARARAKGRAELRLREARAALAGELAPHVLLVHLDSDLGAGERAPRLDDVAHHVDLLLARHVHRDQAHAGARHVRERDVEVDLYSLASTRVHVEVVDRRRSQVRAQLRDDEQCDHAEADQRHDGARAGSLLEVVQGLRVDVQPLDRLGDCRHRLRGGGWLLGPTALPHLHGG
eukprot:scaffold38502_cov45-Phaeocystis_antarctica.AAC.5